MANRKSQAVSSGENASIGIRVILKEGFRQLHRSKTGHILPVSVTVPVLWSALPEQVRHELFQGKAPDKASFDLEKSVEYYYQNRVLGPAKQTANTVHYDDISYFLSAQPPLKFLEEVRPQIDRAVEAYRLAIEQGLPAPALMYEVEDMPTEQDIICLLSSYAEWRELARQVVSRAKPGLESAYAEVQAVLKQYEEQELSEARRREDQELEVALREKERAEAEKRAWVETYGSNHLKRCLELGYPADLIYLSERCAMEFPGFTPCQKGYLRYQKATNPSPTALDIEESVRANPHFQNHAMTVMSVRFEDRNKATKPVRQGEAVVIERYRGEHTILQVTEPKDLDVYFSATAGLSSGE